jgi:hypothetical protein
MTPVRYDALIGGGTYTPANWVRGCLAAVRFIPGATKVIAGLLAQRQYLVSGSLPRNCVLTCDSDRKRRSVSYPQAHSNTLSERTHTFRGPHELNNPQPSYTTRNCSWRMVMWRISPISFYAMQAPFAILTCHEVVV